MDPIPRVNVLGCGISAINLQVAEQAILEAVREKRKGYETVTGVHGVSEAQKDPKFKQILNESFLTTPDGMPMVWCGWKQGFKQMDRVYGPDLMLRIFERSVEHGIRHFFYGGKEGVADMLKAKLEARFPGVQITGTYCPPFRELNDDERAALQRMVTAQKPDIVWVGLSTPKQERFMMRYLPLLDTTLMFGVGAAFDFHAGFVPQAPRWMQRAGMEWFYRLTKEPKRLWKRYLVNNPLFLWRIFCQWTGLKRYPMAVAV
ncbi:MAG TPA: WecB/TagA/CpsF family glycosyltransferase [Verrucomicrobiales bacterium]|jgi:N-acetylglucosaminyldiphosphoundecaprenol N-acetyl-beta-D-mannosaminyltransferase|nr:WecB/TagA/CpsF family glycosyltransferase [Verrucomicrobiales bacterium]